MTFPASRKLHIIIYMILIGLNTRDISSTARDGGSRPAGHGFVSRPIVVPTCKPPVNMRLKRNISYALQACS